MGIPFNLQLGINLIDILLDAPLGKEQLSTHRPASLATLTEREYEIVKLMASRLRNREIAEIL